MDTVRPTPRTTVRQRPDRGSYDRAVIDAILDEGLVCHVGFSVAGAPCVVPMNYARVGDRLVLARSAFRHSLNYRSVVVFGAATEVADRAEKRAALKAILEHVVPGRSRQVRPPSDGELDATTVVALPLAEASAKLRRGPPVDLEADRAAPCWAGEIPLRLAAGRARPDAGVAAARPRPQPPALPRLRPRRAAGRSRSKR